MAELMVYLDDDNFDQEVVKSAVPVLVDFWAEWCAPCRMIAPFLDDLAAEFAGRAKIAKFDVDKGSQTPSRFSVTSIPTLILFKSGQPVDKLTGAAPKNKIKGLIESAL